MVEAKKLLRLRFKENFLYTLCNHIFLARDGKIANGTSPFHHHSPNLS